MVAPLVPLSLSLLRHARSVGNEAATAADRAGAHTVSLPCRDPDVPLSDLGVRQARAMGRLLAGSPALRPELVITSPFRRAWDTAALALQEAGLQVPMQTDERWRDRDLGVLDMYTKAGIEAAFPIEAQRRAWMGKLYYRPPGGESWSDVMLRVRAALADAARIAEGRRILVVTHEVPVLMVRALIEGLSEDKLYQLAGPGYPNASLTTYEPSPDGTARLAAWAQVPDLDGTPRDDSIHGSYDAPTEVSSHGQ